MAMACLGFVTFLPLRPDLSWPFFISFISASTFLPAEGEYFLPDDFFDAVFFAEDFFTPVLRRVLLFFALVPRREEVLEELLFFALPDLFFAAFFVAILILLENQMFAGFESVVWQASRQCASVFFDAAADRETMPRSQFRVAGTEHTIAGQYFTMAANDSGFRLAPPTSAPSISSWPRSAVALSGLTLPP